MSWSWGSYFKDMLDEDRASFQELSTRLADAPPSEHRAIRRDYYGTKNPVSVGQLTPWSADEHPEPQNMGDPQQWVPTATFAVSPILNSKVYCFQGDITSIEADAIVNAANNSLLGGGGVDGAIHSAAGRLLEEECRALNGCNDGDAKITKGYFLPADHVIHTVGPFGSSQQGDSVLRSCYQRSLDVLKENGLRTVVFCGISTGIYGFPLLRATHIALRTTREWMEQNADAIDAVVFCQFLDKECLVYRKLMEAYFPRSAAPVAPVPEVPEVAPAVNEEDVVVQQENGSATAEVNPVEVGDELDGLAPQGDAVGPTP